MTLTFALVITRLSTVFNRDNNAFHRFYSYNLIVSIIFLPDSLAVYFFFITLALPISFMSGCFKSKYEFLSFDGFIRACIIVANIGNWFYLCFFFGSRNNSISNRPTGKYMENLQPLNYEIKHGKINRTHNFIFTTL